MGLLQISRLLLLLTVIIQNFEYISASHKNKQYHRT